MPTLSRFTSRRTILYTVMLHFYSVLTLLCGYLQGDTEDQRNGSRSAQRPHAIRILQMTPVCSHATPMQNIDCSTWNYHTKSILHSPSPFALVFSLAKANDPTEQDTYLTLWKSFVYPVQWVSTLFLLQ